MTNREANKLALVISYYLARFNTEGLTHLGFTSFNQAFEETALRLGVKKNYVKLRRDEFDPAFPWRTGWVRPMDPQIIKTIELFESLDEPEMREIVTGILAGKENQTDGELQVIMTVIQPAKTKGTSKFILRGPTGKKAETFFMNYFKEYQLPVSGELIDTREDGCGYDFKIVSGNKTNYVEVKGLAQSKGGVLFTDKEWKTAKLLGNAYFLVVIKNINDIPEIQTIQNPSQSLLPKKSIYTTLQIQWQVADI